MTGYTAPLDDMLFLLKDVFDGAQLSSLDGYEDATLDTMEAILEEAAKLGRDVIAPLAQTSDKDGAKWHDKAVTTSAGYKEAYSQFVEGGWNGVNASPDHGGMGLPFMVSNAVNEIWNSSCLAFALCPMLTGGAAEAIEHHGSDEQKETYLDNLVSGVWTGTMNLTEPQAGSDLAAIKSKAVPQGDGTYKITGQKIFITYGEHDMTDNIIHLVLARLPDAPAGSKGISLFIVPKFLVNEDGSLGERNDAYCISIEHKLGIHGSPTAVMSYEDATGYLIGGEHNGLMCMFTMMNNARLNVGNEGFAVAERAYQWALAYARDRVQGPLIGSKDKSNVSIDKHPDVRRTLLSMKARTQAARAISTYTALQQDLQVKGSDETTRAKANALVQWLTPIVKAYSTDIGVDCANDGIQIFGGMGFIEESGAAQWLRDSRIAPIYEGTNGIQALDLIGRKTWGSKGQYFEIIHQDISADLATFKAAGGTIATLATPLENALADMKEATDWLMNSASEDMKQAASGAVHYLKLCGHVLGGWLLIKSALIAQQKLDAGEGDPAFLKGKINTAHFFIHQTMPTIAGLKAIFTQGYQAILDCDDSYL